MNIVLRESSKTTEKVYRGMRDRLNASAIKDYAKNRNLFYRKYVLGETVREKVSDSITLGLVVHAILEGTFEEKFTLPVSTPPTGQMLELVNNLYDRTLKSCNEQGVVTEHFGVLLSDAIRKTKYDYNGEEIAFKGKTEEKIVELFTTPDKKSGAVAELYYKELVANTGRTVINENTLIKAEGVVEYAKSHPFTRDILNAITIPGEVEVFNELVVLFSLYNIDCKALIDRIIVNHTTKKISLYDYKTAYDVEDAFVYSYLNKLYYIQGAFYYYAIQAWAIEHGMMDYTIEYPVFIALDTANGSSPLIYPMTATDLKKAVNGFITDRGVEYTGLQEYVEQIKWHIETGEWRHSKNAQDRAGIMSLDVKYA